MNDMLKEFKKSPTLNEIELFTSIGVIQLWDIHESSRSVISHHVTLNQLLRHHIFLRHCHTVQIFSLQASQTSCTKWFCYFFAFFSSYTFSHSHTPSLCQSISLLSLLITLIFTQTRKWFFNSILFPAGLTSGLKRDFVMKIIKCEFTNSQFEETCWSHHLYGRKKLPHIS